MKDAEKVLIMHRDAELPGKLQSAGPHDHVNSVKTASYARTVINQHVHEGAC
jgi:hypothetical protein